MMEMGPNFSATPCLRCGELQQLSSICIGRNFHLDNRTPLSTINALLVSCLVQ